MLFQTAHQTVHATVKAILGQNMWCIETVSKNKELYLFYYFCVTYSFRQHKNVYFWGREQISKPVVWHHKNEQEYLNKIVSVPIGITEERTCTGNETPRRFSEFRVKSFIFPCLLCSTHNVNVERNTSSVHHTSSVRRSCWSKVFLL